ncbi:hypothetical protein ACQ4PT_047053 [Festuca glaucescens]
MADLANMFASLDLDDEGDGEELEQPSSSKPAAAAATKKIDGGMEKRKMIVNYDGKNLSSLPGEYKMPLVWIDLEMTGLDIRKDRILEISCIITDGKLTKRIEVAFKQNIIGLTEQVLQSDISEHDAEKQVLDFIRRHIGSTTPLIAGNSIYTDLLFLKEYMPELAGIFPHVIVDVSSIMALCIHWFPKGKIVHQYLSIQRWRILISLYACVLSLVQTRLVQFFSCDCGVAS